MEGTREERKREKRGQKGETVPTRQLSRRTIMAVMEPTMLVSTEHKMEPITIQVMDMHATPMDNATMDLTIRPMDLFTRRMDHMPTL